MIDGTRGKQSREPTLFQLFLNFFCSKFIILAIFLVSVLYTLTFRGSLIFVLNFFVKIYNIVFIMDA